MKATVNDLERVRAALERKVNSPVETMTCEDRAGLARSNAPRRRHPRTLVVFAALLAVTAGAPAHASSPRSTQPRLPLAVRGYLEQRGLRAVTGRPGCNVFRGHFFRPSQTDLAVACVDESSVRLLVFHAGGIAHVDEVLRQDVHGVSATQFFETVPCPFTRASPKVVRYFHEAWSNDPEGGDEAPSIRPVRHDGIEQWEAECCSVIHYWDGGRWWKITGMD